MLHFQSISASASLLWHFVQGSVCHVAHACLVSSLALSSFDSEYTAHYYTGFEEAVLTPRTMQPSILEPFPLFLVH